MVDEHGDVTSSKQNKRVQYSGEWHDARISDSYLRGVATGCREAGFAVWHGIDLQNGLGFVVSNRPARITRCERSGREPWMTEGRLELRAYRPYRASAVSASRDARPGESGSARAIADSAKALTLGWGRVASMCHAAWRLTLRFPPEGACVLSREARRRHASFWRGSSTVSHARQDAVTPPFGVGRRQPRKCVDGVAPRVMSLANASVVWRLTS